MKKKTIKNFSRTFLLGFFVFQFGVMTSFAPIIARAQEAEISEKDSSVEESRVAEDSKPSIDESQKEGDFGFDISLGESVKEVVEDVAKSVFGIPPPPNDECDALPVYARVNLVNFPATDAFGKTNEGWGNTGSGNMAPKIYVGGTDSDTNEDGGDVYDPGEWFPIYSPLSGYFNDPLLTDVDPGIDGLAVQRLNGQLRVVLYGSHSQPQGNLLTNREMAHGFIEFSNDQSSVSSDVVIVNQINDAVNPLETNGNNAGGQYTGNPVDWPTNDAMWFTSTASHFKFVVNIHNDGMYTVFTHTIPDENCDDENQNNPPYISVNPSEVCLTIQETSFNFMSGVIATDAEDGIITSSVIFNSDVVIFGTPGAYIVTYFVADSLGLVAEAHRTIYIKEKCDGGNDDGGHDPINICHTAGQSGNYVFLTVDDDATLGGHGNHSDDIIPITDVNGDNQINQQDCDDYSDNGGSCDATSNLLGNGGFEKPVITNSNNWNIYNNGTPGLVWEVDWQPGSGGVNTPKAELQKIYTAQDGNQYLELDSDFDGPGGSINNESASTNISQTISTVPGQKYRITYYYSARPGYSYDDNKVGLYIDGFPWDLSTTSNGIGRTDTEWYLKTNHFTANSNSHTITFADLGTANSYGMFLDNIKVNCVEEEEDEDDEKDACPDVPGNQTSTEECDDDGGDDGDSPIISINDQTCVAVGGNYNFAANSSATDTEDGTVTVVIDSSDVDFGTAGSYNVIYTATDTDGNVTVVIKTFSVSDSCGGTGGGDDLPPAITITGASCIDVNAQTFDFLAGVSAEDDLDGTIALNLTDNVLGEENVQFGVVGSYNVTYTVTDSASQTTSIVRVITISNDCDNGNGGNGGNGGSGGSGGGGGGSVLSSGSFGGGSGGGNLGEVLGASTCAQFTQYHDTGSTQGEVRALQTFLNEYMNAGLVVNGIYDWATTQAVHNFQAKHWNEIIKPWLGAPSGINPNTTGRTRQTTTMAMNFIIKCPNEAKYLEDPMIMYEITEIKDEDMLSEEQITRIVSLLDEAHIGLVLGAEVMEK